MRYELIKRPLTYCLALLFILLFISPAMPADLKKAVFIPHWVPQAQFAGYYVAYEMGIYRKHGIDLAIIPGGSETPPLDLLKDERAQFGSLWLSTAIEARAQGVELVNVAQIMQKSGLILVAKKSGGIKEPKDMNGKKVGIWDSFKVQPKAFFNKYNLDVKTITQSYSVNLFLSGGVDVASAMWYNEYHTILNSGLNPDELVTFFFYEHDLNFPEDGIYVMKNTLDQDPELVRAFVAASLEGWRYAFDHPEEALDIIIKNLTKEHMPASRVHQRWMLNRMKDLIPLTEAGISGKLKEDDYYRVGKGLKDNGLIEEIPPFAAFYQE